MPVKLHTQKRVFKGIWIPKEIWLNPNLTPIEKLLLVEVDSLDNEDEKGCFASNEYFGKFFGLSEGRIANMISSLKKRDFLFQVFFDGRNRGLRVHENVKAGLTKKGKSVHENVKPDFTKRGKPVSRKREHNNTVNNPTNNPDSEGERTPPAPNPSNLQSQKNESGFVAPAENPETVKAEIPPLPKVAPKGIPPVRLDAKEIRGLVDLTETYPFGFCETCQGQKVVGGRNGLIECPTCEGTGLGNGRTESENPPPAQFEVTAIASPTDLPGVTLVEAAPIHHRKNGRIEIPDEAAAEILPWVKGDGAQTVKSWYDRAFRQHSPKDVEDMVMRFSTVFLSSEKAAFRDMMETNPLSFFKRRFAGFVADQKQYDRNNAPKEGGATRQTPPSNFQTSTRH